MTNPPILTLNPYVYGSQVVVDGTMYIYNKKVKLYIAEYFQETYERMGCPIIGDGTDPTYYKHMGDKKGQDFYAKQLDLFS